MIKLIASDLDGTLLNRFHQADRYILNTIDKVLAKDIVFVVATGRNMQEGKEFGLDFKNRPIYIISNNGAQIKDTAGKTIFTKALPKEFVKATLEKFSTLPLTFVTSSDILVSVSKTDYLHGFNTEKRLINRRILKLVHHHSQTRSFEVPHQEILKQEILKINVRIYDKEISNDFQKHLEAFPEVVNAPYDNGIFEITERSVNKASSLRILCDQLKIDYDQVVVFGDGGNDLELLSEFKHSYAVSNASKEAKARAKWIIGNAFLYSVSRKIRKLIQRNSAD